MSTTCCTRAPRDHRTLISVFATLTALSAMGSAADTATVARQRDRSGGLTAHGFVQENGVFTTIDAPRTGLFTVAFGVGDNGETVGGYVDTGGLIHGFVRTDETFTRIDVPGAAATFASRINATGQIVGAYSEDDPNLPALELPRGFVLDIESGVFTKIDVPGAVRTQPFGINASGQIVGEYVDAAGKTHGFLLDHGAFTALDAPGGTATVAMDIDDSGRIVGFSFDATGTFHGFLRDDRGSFTAIDAPDAVRGTLPFGINNRGQVAGLFLSVVNDAVQGRGFVLENGVFTTIDAPDATVSTVVFDIGGRGQLAGAYDVTGHGYIRDQRGEFMTVDPPEGNINEIVSINTRGQIVGRYVDEMGTNRGFLQDKRTFTSIDVPGARATATYKINDRGQIVGSYSAVSNNTGYPVRGYLLDAGVFTTIDVPGAQHTSALDIDNHGRIVGEYQDAAGNFHGFLRDTTGTFSTIDVPGAAVTSISGINDRGQIVGAYADASGTAHGVLMDRGVFTIVDAPGATLTVPFAINNRGQIVGIASDGLRNRGFVLSEGRFTRITPPGALVPYLVGTFASDIDDRGRIAGASL